MVEVEHYMSMTDPFERVRVLQEGHNEKAAARYRLAGLYAAEAAIKLREEYPNAARVEFRFCEEADGSSTTIVAVYEPDGDAVYVEDDERFEYYEDQSEPGDNLAAAVEQDAGVFDQIGGLYSYVLPSA